MQSLPHSEKLFLGDFNHHIGTRANGYDRTHEGFGYGERNNGGVVILDFAVAFGLTVVNSLFRKKDHSVT